VRTASRHRRRWSSLLQPVALALLALIAADVVADADCDPLRLGTPSAETEIAGAVPTGDPTADPCSDVCLPDCFCCARSVVALSAVVPPAPVPLAPLARSGWDDRLDGVHRPVERPPRT
jgi:hypothetical protein